ncbi:hypothetical protein LZG37_19645 [Halomonas titanicae]|uniref:hypothetical protein n=1 Tax=Vreelandella titanicae TaxID=664683 RepID=UPI000B7FA064|nr:hypothetical protein [Halomonas titanicae]MCE7520356.1 hypothetical protein [Halomonas titanicae]
MEQWHDWFKSVLNRMMDQTGAITLFIAASAAGAGGIVGGSSVAIWSALAAFGLVGALEIYNRQKEAQAIQLRQSRRREIDGDRLFRVADTNPSWRPKQLHEITHGGLKWNAVGFQELPVPLAVTGPLCPRCSHKLAETIEVSFPGRLTINVFCMCGFKTRLNKPVDALHEEVSQMVGTPN